MNRPFLLAPAAKDYLWGGNRLNDDFGKNIELSPLAETWECSTHPDGQSSAVMPNEKQMFSPAAEGAMTDAGTKTFLLRDVLKAHPEYLGTHPLKTTEGMPELPILVKLIDAERDLSIQVHPSAECAAKYPGDSEKTEMWYVIDCAEGASLIHGFNEKFELERFKKKKTKNNTYFSEIKDKIEEGKITDILRRAEVRPGDVFFVEPGTVHAIGRGILLAEVQQNSDTTYRVYDYGRLGSDGKPRELHVEKALDAVKSAKTGSCPHTDVTDSFSFGTLRRVACDKFTADIVSLNGEFTDAAESFFSVVVLSGNAAIRWGDGELDVSKGDSVYVPKDCAVSIAGKCSLLISRPAC